MNWSDWGNDKFFHVLDIDTGEFEAIKNPYTLFNKIEYSDSPDFIKQLKKKDFHKKYCRLVINHTVTDYGKLDKSIAKIESFEPYDLQIQDFSSIDLSINNPANEDMVSVEESSGDDNPIMKSTYDFVMDYIDLLIDKNQESFGDKEKFKKLVSDCYKEAEQMESF